MKGNSIKSHKGCLWTGLALVLIVGALQVKSDWDLGKIPWYMPIKVQEIIAPTKIKESEPATIVLEHEGGYFRRHPHFKEDDRIVYEWSCDPATAGTFSRSAAVTTFAPNEVEQNLQVKLMCKVYAPDTEPVEEETSMTIEDTPAVGDWVRTIGSSFEAGAKAIDVAVDSKGLAYLAGNYNGDLFCKSGNQYSSRFSHYDEAGFIAVYDEQGNLVRLLDWGNQPAGGSIDHQISSIAIDKSDNLYVAGKYNSKMDLDPGPGVDIHTAPSYSAGYLLKINPEGVYKWSNTWGGSGLVRNNNAAEAPDIACLSNGKIAVVGQCVGAAKVGPDGRSMLCSGYTPTSSVFLTVMDQEGRIDWLQNRALTGSYNNNSVSVACDKVDNLFVLYQPPGTILEKFNVSGTSLWKQEAGAVRRTSLAVDEEGSVYWASFFNDAEKWSKISPENARVPIEGWYYLIKFDKDGQFKWLSGNPNSDPMGNKAIVDMKGKIALLCEYRKDLRAADIRLDEYNTDLNNFILIIFLDYNGNILMYKDWFGANDGEQTLSTVDSSGNLYIAGSRNMKQWDAYDSLLMRVPVSLLEPEK